MEYVPLDNILKRNIDQTISNEDESFALPNKRSCVIEEVKFYPKDSIESLKVHIDTEWNFTNNDFEHATSTESITYIRTQRIKPMSIIFHFASEDIMDIEKYGSDNIVTVLNSIYSADHLPTFSVHDLYTISMKKSSQSEAISSHLINTKRTNSSSLSISDTSLDRSLERLQANYREYLTRKKAETKSNVYQQQSTTVDTQAYIRCRKHRQSIPVQIIGPDSEAKIYQFT